MISRLLLGIYLGGLVSNVYSSDNKAQNNMAADTTAAQQNLSAEGVATDVTAIDFYKTGDKFHRLLTYNHGEQTFKSSQSDKFVDTVQNGSLQKYSNIETLTFNDMDFLRDGNVANLLELAGINSLKKLQDIAFVNCKNLAEPEGEKILIRCLSDVAKFNSLVISPAIGEKFPSELLKWIANEKNLEKCNSLSVLSLLVDELNEETAHAIAAIISKASKSLTTLCLSIKKSPPDSNLLGVIADSIKNSQNITYFAVSFEKDVAPDDIKTFFANINNSKDVIKTLVTMKVDFNNTSFNNPSNRDSTGMVRPVSELCQMLKNQEQLREFDMSGSQLDSVFYSKIFNEGLVNNHNIESLKLNNIINFSNDNMKDLATLLKTMQNLQELELKNCDMQHSVFSGVISSIEAISGLMSLKLDNNKLTNIGDIPTKCGKLITISIANNTLDKNTIQKMIENISKDDMRQTPLIINLQNNIDNVNDIKELHNKYISSILPSMSESKPIRFAFIL